jgi:hypothetical protein
MTNKDDRSATTISKRRGARISTHKQVLAERGKLEIDRALPVGAVEVLFETDTVVDARRAQAAPLRTQER